MDKETFLKEVEKDRVVIEVNPAGKTQQLNFVSESTDIPNTLLFKDEEGKIVSRILDKEKLNSKIGTTKFFFNPEDAISYCNRLYLVKMLSK